VLAVLAWWATAAHSAELRLPPHELYLPVMASNQRFFIPREHVLGDASPFLAAPSGGDTKAAGEFLVRFSAAWLGAHVEGFQPILNHAFQPATVHVIVTLPGGAQSSLAPGVAEDAWYGRNGWEGGKAVGEREPITGLYVIKQIPSPAGRRDFWSGVLAESLPIPDMPYPTDPPWIPMVCTHGHALITRASRAYTSCAMKSRPSRNVFFTAQVRGENLRIRDAVLQAIGEEILRWRELAERQAREAPSDAPH